MTIIERWALRERIEDLGHVRRVLSEQADRQASDRNAGQANGYDSSLSHAIKRLDRTIGYLCLLDADTRSPEREQAGRTTASTTTGKERYKARQLARCRRAYARGRAAAARDAKQDVKQGEPKVTPNPYGITDSASVSWTHGYRGIVVNWKDA